MGSLEGAGSNCNTGGRPSNGRVENEINQLKRRLRLVMHVSGAERHEWPTFARHAAEQVVDGE